MPRIETLRVFCLVVENGSFSRAAEILHLSQPAVSQQIKRLEQEYNKTLLHRDGMEVVPTEEGSAVYQYATQILRLYRKSKDSIHQEDSELSGVLSIGASTGLGECLLPIALGRFKCAHPEVKIEMDVADSAQILDQIVQGRIELGFVGMTRRDRHVTSELFVEDHLVLVVSPESAFAQHRSISLEQFLDTPLVLQQPGSGATAALRLSLRAQGIRVESLNVVMEAGLQESAKSLVSLGMGGTVISRLGILEDLRSGHLVEVHVDGLELSHDYFVAYRRDAPLSRRAREFLTVARVIASEYRQMR